MGLLGSFLGGPAKPKASTLSKYKRVGKASFKRTMEEGGLKLTDRKEIGETLGKDYFRGGRQRSYKQIEDDLKKGKIKKSVLDRSKKAIEKVYEPKATGPTEKQKRRNIAVGRVLSEQLDTKRQGKNVLGEIKEDSSRLVNKERQAKYQVSMGGKKMSEGDFRGTQVADDYPGQAPPVSIGQKSASVAGGLGVANKPTGVKPNNVIRGNFGNKGASGGVPPIGIKKAGNS